MRESDVNDGLCPQLLQLYVMKLYMLRQATISMRTVQCSHHVKPCRPLFTSSCYLLIACTILSLSSSPFPQPISPLHHHTTALWLTAPCRSDGKEYTPTQTLPRRRLRRFDRSWWSIRRLSFRSSSSHGILRTHLLPRRPAADRRIHAPSSVLQ